VEQLGDVPWAEVAVECGFYDQAHFIKECRQFSGLTPPALFGQLSPMTEQFTRKNR
jgi:AraC-like DNA-binding protein